MSLSKKKNNFLCHSSDFWDRVSEFRGQTERYIHPGEYVGHRRRWAAGEWPQLDLDPGRLVGRKSCEDWTPDGCTKCYIYEWWSHGRLYVPV